MDATKRTITITRHEYVLLTPAAVGELYKALDLANSELPEDRRQWDDALFVETRDDEIVISWEEKG